MIERNTLVLNDNEASDAGFVNELGAPEITSVYTEPRGWELLNKKRGRRKLLMAGLVVGDVMAIVTAFVFASFVWLSYLDRDQLVPIFVTILPIYLAVSLDNKGYSVKVLNDLSMGISRIIRAMSFAIITMLLILFFFKTSISFSRALFAIGTLGSFGLLICNRLLFKTLSTFALGSSQFADLCIYDGVEFGQKAGENSIQAANFGISADMRDPNSLDRLGRIVSDLDRVIIHCSPEKRESWIFLLRSIDIKSEIVTPELDSIKPLEIRERSGSTSLLISAGHLRLDQQILKRLFDLGFLLVTLPIFLPIMMFTAILIKLDSRGPIFFVQHRIGQGNRSFSILKFRSMYSDALDVQGTVSTTRDDKRVTPIGRVIRKTSIDELPQIFNVLKGDMSVVGPRPHATGSRAENELFWDIDDRYWHRHVVKPGLTGLAQIRGFRGATEKRADLSNRLQSDLEYVSRWSLLGDIKIIIKTLAVVLHPNAY